jgi:hypothetical protein
MGLTYVVVAGVLSTLFAASPLDRLEPAVVLAATTSADVVLSLLTPTPRTIWKRQRGFSLVVAEPDDLVPLA